MAMEGLSQANIWIDDTAGISTTEMRSKARRLQAEHGVDLIIVDYLQLMQATVGNKRNENRVQEVSEISRSLKGLARELNVPVLALAQLSRTVESRQSKVPQLSDLRESGCLAGESLVYLPDEGIYRPIEQLVGQKDFRVLALNTETWQLEPAIVTNAFSTGHKPVYRLTTRLGRTIRATANHKFLTIHGWKRLDELTMDDRIALPRNLTGPTQATMSDDELALLGHLIGDGCTLPGHAIQYTTNDQTLAEVVAENKTIPIIATEALIANVTTYLNRNEYTRNLSGERATKIASMIQSQQLAMLAQSDVYWDKPLSIEPDGETEVYDLTVDKHHNFIANNVTCHNSIEQDADIVMFIYRDDVYNPDSERKNIADIIVAKHRNGPVGEVSLYFQASQTRFHDLEATPPTE